MVIFLGLLSGCFCLSCDDLVEYVAFSCARVAIHKHQRDCSCKVERRISVHLQRNEPKISLHSGIFSAFSPSKYLPFLPSYINIEALFQFHARFAPSSSSLRTPHVIDPMSSSTASGSASSDHLPTPALDRESSALLHSISEHGGYAYVSMAALATLGDFRASEAAREKAWEQLHSGPRHSVLPVWLDAYSMACLHVAKHHYINREFKEALRALDMGLIMGGSLLKKDLSSAADKVSERLRNIRASKESHEVFGMSEHRLLSHELNQAEVRPDPLLS